MGWPFKHCAQLKKDIFPNVICYIYIPLLFIACSFVTEHSNASTYVFKFVLKTLIMPFRLDFTVKASHDALIALAENKTKESTCADISKY